MAQRYRYGDPDFWESLTTPSMRARLDAARAIGWAFGPMLMADGERTDVPVVGMLEMPPNGVLPRNRRGCDRIEVIVRGSVDVGDGVTLGPGDVEVTRAGEFFGPHVAGPDGVLSVEVFGRSDRMEIEFEDPESAVQQMTGSARGGR